MASFQARSPLRSAHPLFLINKVISLTAFVILLCAGWVALSYIKTELSARWRSPEAHPAIAAKEATATPIQTSEAGIAVKTQSAPVRLVYSCTGDNEHYHTTTHLPPHSERTALSEEAARQRGLKPCGICMP